MIAPLTAAGSAEIAVRLRSRLPARTWCVVLAPVAQADGVTVELHRAIEAYVDGAGVEVSNVAGGGDAFCDAVRTATEPALILGGVEDDTDADWMVIDRRRSELGRAVLVLLVMSEAAFERMTRSAPNLMSWLGGLVWRWDMHAEDLTEEERNMHLEVLDLIVHGLRPMRPKARSLRG